LVLFFAIFVGTKIFFLMKNLLFLICFICLIASSACKKTISTDLPLTKERTQSVFISTNNNNLISYSAASGAKQWEIQLKDANNGVPAMLGGRLYLLTKFGYFYAIDVLDGKIKIEKNLGLVENQALITQPSLGIFNNEIYIASNKLYKYDTLGNLKWTYNPGSACTTSPTFVDTNIIIGCGTTVQAIGYKAGGNIWTSTPIVTLATNDIIRSSPKVNGKVIYFGADNKKVYFINLKDGSLIKDYLTNDKVLSSPMLYGGMCIVGSQDFGVHCIDTNSCTKRWVFPTAERVYSSPTIHELTNTVLVGSYDFNLYAIDHVSGALRWKFPTGSLIKSSPVVLNNYVYFTSYDRYLYCVDVRNGSLVWKSFLNAISDSSPLIDLNENGLNISPSISGMSKY
jgi:outer membrane protein assembly factor BamB